MTRAIACTTWVIAVAVLFGCDAGSKKEAAILEGEWNVVSVTKENGPEIKGPGIKFLIAANKFTVTIPDGKTNTATIRTDTTATPAAIDMTRDSDGEGAIPGKGIWWVDKNKLTLCFAIGERDRPKDFKPTETNIVFVCERVAK
jgi:uncharacterized protein (TIGR03067 family)